MTSHLIVVTGPPGVDIGPAAARLAARPPIGDGLAVRVINSTNGGWAHTSPDPYHRHTLDEATRCTGTADDPCTENRVRLRYLPSAWQNPDTNLGVVFTGHPHVGLNPDLIEMDKLGLDPSHRVTVQANGIMSKGFTYPSPVEMGDVGAHARDAVLRAGGRVLIEAGEGMTHLEALGALRLPPWAPWIRWLSLWSVFDVDQMPGLDEGSPTPEDRAIRIAKEAVAGLGRLAAVVDGTAVKIRTNVILLGVPEDNSPFVAHAVHMASEFGVDRVCCTIDAI